MEALFPSPLSTLTYAPAVSLLHDCDGQEQGLAAQGPLFKGTGHSSCVLLSSGLSSHATIQTSQSHPPMGTRAPPPTVTTKPAYHSLCVR